MNHHPHDLRANIAFALDLADSHGITVQTVNADEWGTVTLYAWATGFPTIAEIADREGWPPEVRSGEGWQSRRQTFDVAGRQVEIDLIGDATEATR